MKKSKKQKTFKYIKGHVTKIRVRNSQHKQLENHAGARRFCYNHAVAYCYSLLEANGVRNEPDKWSQFLPKTKGELRDWMTSEKNTNPKFAWLKIEKISKCVPSIAAEDCFMAFERYIIEFFDKTVERAIATYKRKCDRKGRDYDQDKIDDMCKPKYQKSGRNERFSFDTSLSFIKDKPTHFLKMPSFGEVRLAEPLKDLPSKVTIRNNNDKWYISTYREFEPEFVEEFESDGIAFDYGLNKQVVLSDGTEFANPRFRDKFKKKIAFYTKSCKRKYDKTKKPEEQSNNYKKTKLKLSKLYQRQENCRKDNLHKITSKLSKSQAKIYGEDLNVSGMMKNHNLAGALQDVSPYEFARQIAYKSKWYGSEYVPIDRYFPSSKLCSCCGWKKTNLSLKDREFVCESCGLVIDRDLNAALNIKKEGQRIAASGSSGFATQSGTG